MYAIRTGDDVTHVTTDLKKANAWLDGGGGATTRETVQVSGTPTLTVYLILYTQVTKFAHRWNRAEYPEQQWDVERVLHPWAFADRSAAKEAKAKLKTELYSDMAKQGISDLIVSMSFESFTLLELSIE